MQKVKRSTSVVDFCCGNRYLTIIERSLLFFSFSSFFFFSSPLPSLLAKIFANRDESESYRGKQAIKIPHGHKWKVKSTRTNARVRALDKDYAFYMRDIHSDTFVVISLRSIGVYPRHRFSCIDTNVFSKWLSIDTY